ncbi:hypothetical protein EMIT0194MI4_10805 [Pseudomonas sp. IT-194MI4]
MLFKITQNFLGDLVLDLPSTSVVPL